MKILIVDDDLDTRNLLKQTIEDELPLDIHFYESEDGLEAVEMFKSNRPDWVLMDIELKSMNGLTATGIIKEEDPDAKVIIVSGFDDSEYQEVANNFGVMGYILKKDTSEVPRIIEAELAIKLKNMIDKNSERR